MKALIIFAFAILIQASFAAKILIFVPGISTSHILFNYRLAAALIAKGHNVTLWTMLDWPLKGHSLEKPDEVEEFEVLIDLPAKNISSRLSIMDELAFKELGFRDYREIVNSLRVNFFVACQIQLEDNEDLIQELSKRNYDLLLSHGFDLCPIAIAHVMDLGDRFTFVAPGTFILDLWANIIGLPVAPSFIPNAMRASSDSMGFMDRVKNTITLSMMILMEIFPNVFSDEEEMFRAPPHGNRPSFKMLWHEINSLFINGEPFLDFPRPFPNGVIYLGELAAQGSKKTTKELSLEFRRILEKPSSKGTILFSLGTIAKAKHMPEAMRKAFAEAFIELSDYEILWRFDAEVPEVEEFPHIHLLKWLPQRDLLNHPSVKLFVTHGGYNSLLEVTKAGVPMVLIPLFSDQYGNGARAERHGIGVVVQKSEITKESILGAMNTILNDPQYTAKAKKLAQTLNDKVVDPGVLLDHRVRFLAEKRNRLPTLKAGKRLSFIQYQSLDILAFFLSIAVTSCCIVWKVVFVCYRIAKGKN